jgi:hypothetical protein
MVAGPDQTSIRRLSLRAGGGVGNRPLRARRMLAGLDLAPPGLPRGALLVIRQIRDPLPGKLRLDDSGQGTALVWERAVRALVGRLAEAAPRPAAGTVRDDAPAVLFTQPSEMLACLARDWLHGDHARWWWRTLFPGGVDDVVLVRVLHEQIGALPAALRLLQPGGDTGELVARLSPAQVRTLREALTVSFGLGALHAALVDDTRAMPLPGPLAAAATSGQGVARTRMQPHAPWRAWLPTYGAAALPPEHALFLGIALGLAQDASRTRSPAFAAAARCWWQAQRAPETTASNDASTAVPVLSGESGDRKPLAVPAAIDGPPSGKANLPSKLAADPSATPSPRFDAGAVTSPATDRSAISAETAARGAALPTAAEAPAASPPPPALTLPDLPLAPRRALLADVPVDYDDVVQPGHRIQTEFGGVFYLVNLALFLELYGDFSQPLRPGLSLSIWDFLALVGDDLLGPELRADPLWPLLAALAGRKPDIAPGVGFRPPRHWRLPPAWLRPFASPDDNEAWGCGELSFHRLRVDHPAGFAVLDLLGPRRPDARAVDRQLARYGAPAWRFVAAVPPLSPHARQRWQDWLMPYLRVRLGRALGLPADGDAAARLCRHHATVAVSDDAVDISLSLDRHPIAIRWSGLDRDPGWVPAAGRRFCFHFS